MEGAIKKTDNSKFDPKHISKYKCEKEETGNREQMLRSAEGQWQKVHENAFLATLQLSKFFWLSKNPIGSKFSRKLTVRLEGVNPPTAFP